ncbi:MAG: glycerophosphodiester phosphodiesterase family protein [Pseudomonadota bacterium]
MTRIVCHRGACRHAPENTIASGLKALELGGDMIELDVRQSRDGVLYVLHDETLDRTTNGSGPIAEWDSAELDRLDAGAWFGSDWAGTALPRFDAFLKALKDKAAGFYIEIKAADPALVAEVVLDCEVPSYSFTFSFDATIREGMARHAPWLRRMMHIDVSKPYDLCAIAGEGVDLVEFKAADLTSRRVADAQRTGMEVMIYTPDQDEAVYQDAIDLGVDYLNIDYPETASRLRDQPMDLAS